MKPWRKAVRVLLRRGDNILLVKHHELGDYTLPGGGVEPEESVYEATNRELAEELSLTTSDFRIDTVGEHLHFYEYPEDGKPHRGQEETIVVATLNPGARPVKDGEEVLATRFAPVNEIPFPQLRAAARAALEPRP